ncbi:hypothetical protein [uncultured Ilyobacter sp.]|uniref:hypothetical protein n=1 Tax=uncultured Ilyobacter sp. TaxID=544433 RepID=UPI002AA962C5|nr:hypothetical protein [uncultured Ilyobacter sp.]
MKKIQLIIFLFIIQGISFGEQIFYGEHYTGIEYLHSDLIGEETSDIDAYTLTLGKGYYSFINYPEDFEGTFKYDVKAENHSMLDNIGYASLGGRFQYNGWGNKGIILGVKGALDYDNFYETYSDYFSRYIIEGEYPRKSGKTVDEEDLGIKFYGDVFKKMGHGITIGFWNDIVVGKEEIDDPISVVTSDGSSVVFSEDDESYENESLSLTITPKIIYENLFDNGIKFVFEGYMENRKYYNETFEINDREEDTYYKWVINPQLITKNRITENLTFDSYTAFENEQFQYLSYWQHIFKTTPKLEYSKGKWRSGISGGGYDFDDEIGIVFDNRELFAYKKADEYSAWIFSPRIYLEYNVKGGFYVGHESNYRYGEWQTSTEDQYLEERGVIFYWKYIKKLSEVTSFIVKNSYEIYRFSTDISEEDQLPGENVIRISTGFKTVF